MPCSTDKNESGRSNKRKRESERERYSLVETERTREEEYKIYVIIYYIVGEIVI